jgi:hypothetical protein
VSWTHHQFWTVIACAALVALGSRAAYAGAVVAYLLMTVSFAAVADQIPQPLQFIVENSRALTAIILVAVLSTALKDSSGSAPAVGERASTGAAAVHRLPDR